MLLALWSANQVSQEVHRSEAHLIVGTLYSGDLEASEDIGSNTESRQGEVARNL